MLLFYMFLIVNKSYEKPKNVFDLLFLSVALTFVPTEDVNL